MPFTTILSPADLAAHLADPDWVVIDCRFSLIDSEAGRRNYLADHIPGAVYAHLGEHLSGVYIPGKTGKHPLPAVEIFAATLSQWGIDDSVQVVVYDDAGGLIAGRVWWMLRWLGHDAVAVLDGDWRAWQAEAGRWGAGEMGRQGEETRSPRNFVARARPELVASLAEVEAEVDNPQRRLLDARAADRFRGENETLYPIAGHIPSAVCAWFGGNLTADGHFQSPAFLRERFNRLLGNIPPEQAIFYCGSGVSACNNLLAMAIAGLPEGRLFVGSWSQWSADPNRPIATTS